MNAKELILKINMLDDTDVCFHKGCNIESVKKLGDIKRYIRNNILNASQNYREIDVQSFAIIDGNLIINVGKLNTTIIEKAEQLYDDLDLDSGLIYLDYQIDMLTINKGKDGDRYLWYHDGVKEGAISIDDGRIISGSMIKELNLFR